MAPEAVDGHVFTALAFDVGAESGRGIVGAFDGDRIELHEVTRFANRSRVVAGHPCWDTQLLRSEVRRAIAIAADRGWTLDSVGVDTWGVDFGVVDGRGRLLAEPRQYRTVGRAGFDEALSVLTSREIYEATGIQLMPFNTLFQMVARRHEFDGDKRILFVPDLINLDLCGAAVTESTIASTSGLLAVGTSEWADDLLGALDVPRSALPEVVQPGTTLGMLDDGLAAALGCRSAPAVTKISKQ